jgi:hypothetical protein
MFDSRRRFLARFGVGVVGAGTLLLPGAAQACGRRRGLVIGCPPPDFCPPGEVLGEHGRHRVTAKFGPVTCSFPDVSLGAQIPGNGTFFSWGSVDSGFFIAPGANGLQLVNGDGTGGTTATAIGMSAVQSLSSPGSNPWSFRCTAPVGTQFYLLFGYVKPPDPTVVFITPPYPGPFTCVGF